MTKQKKMYAGIIHPDTWDKMFKTQHVSWLVLTSLLLLCLLLFLDSRHLQPNGALSREEGDDLLKQQDAARHPQNWPQPVYKAVLQVGVAAAGELNGEGQDGVKDGSRNTSTCVNHSSDHSCDEVSSKFFVQFVDMQGGSLDREGAAQLNGRGLHQSPTERVEASEPEPLVPDVDVGETQRPDGCCEILRGDRGCELAGDEDDGRPDRVGPAAKALQDPARVTRRSPESWQMDNRHDVGEGEADQQLQLRRLTQ